MRYVTAGDSRNAPARGARGGNASPGRAERYSSASPARDVRPGISRPRRSLRPSRVTASSGLRRLQSTCHRSRVQIIAAAKCGCRGPGLRNPTTPARHENAYRLLPRPTSITPHRRQRTVWGWVPPSPSCWVVCPAPVTGSAGGGATRCEPESRVVRGGGSRSRASAQELTRVTAGRCSPASQAFQQPPRCDIDAVITATLPHRVGSWLGWDGTREPCVL
jgi:hypothetical protein